MRAPVFALRARPWELRAAMSRRRLWQRQGTRGGPHSAGEVDGWFTEGFDTIDLREARGRLDRLA